MIVKPIAGAGSADTYRCDDAGPSSSARSPWSGHVAEVSVEEFIDGEEFTFDTICADGRALLRQRLLVPPAAAGRAPERVDQPADDRAARTSTRPTSRAAARMGREVLAGARLPDRLHPHGVVPQGRRRGRVRRDRRRGRPGARTVDVMNYACDIDIYAGWAEAVVHGRVAAPLRAQVERGLHLQAGPGAGPHPAHRRARQGPARLRALRRRGRSHPGRRAAQELEAVDRQRRLRRRPPSRARPGARHGRPHRPRSPPLRRLRQVRRRPAPAANRFGAFPYLLLEEFPWSDSVRSPPVCSCCPSSRSPAVRPRAPIAPSGCAARRSRRTGGPSPSATGAISGPCRRAGGAATPRTLNAGYDTAPVWSPDGSRIAFASDRYGNFDVFVMPAGGGEATRLTVPFADDVPTSFTPDGKGVLFSSARLDAVTNAQFPSPAQPELYRVDLAGGMPVRCSRPRPPTPSGTAPASVLAYSDQKGYEMEWRKHDNSSFARDVWVWDRGDQQPPAADRLRGRRPPAGLGAGPGFALLPLGEERQLQRLEAPARGPSARSRSRPTPRTRSASSPPRTAGDLCYAWDGGSDVRPAGAAESRGSRSVRPSTAATSRGRRSTSRARSPSSRSRRTARRSPSWSAARCSSPRSSTA